MSQHGADIYFDIVLEDATLVDQNGKTVRRFPKSEPAETVVIVQVVIR
jgi:hypothetical protein